MKQLKLPLESIDCRYYQNCGAPMCPKDVNFGRYLWFPKEPVCRLKAVPNWVEKQRKIAKLKDIDPNKYFTLRMLNSLEEIWHGLEGIDPEYFGGDKLWLSKQSNKKTADELDVAKSKNDSDHEFELDAGNYPLF